MLSNQIEGKILNAKNGRIQLSREDLAKLVGTATESVIRCLSEFEEDNLVEISGRDIAILNQKGLETIQ